MGKITKKLQEYTINIVKAYQYIVSPLLGNCCRFYPSCSEYAVQAIKQYGIIVGLFKTSCRIFKCQPWHAGGHDPVVRKCNK